MAWMKVIVAAIVAGLTAATAPQVLKSWPETLQWVRRHMDGSKAPSYRLEAHFAGDVIALMASCPALALQRDVYEKRLKPSGLDASALIDEDGRYFSFLLDRIDESKSQYRRLSRTAACSLAVERFGLNGSIEPGLVDFVSR